MSMQCIFCDIGKKIVKSKVVWEDDEFAAFEDINPQAPVHIVLISKEHIEKIDAMHGLKSGIWDKFFKAAYEIIKKYGLDETGYKIVNNGAGYNHLEHEHLHIIGGKDWKPDYQP